MITDISGSQPSERSDHSVLLPVETSIAFPNRLILSRSRAVGSLMDVVVGAAVEHGRSPITTNEALSQKAEVSWERQPFEVLVDGHPCSDFGGQGPPRERSAS